MDADVPQCGYCQSGQTMSAAALLAKNSHPADAEIEEAMAGNISRCGTYQQIKEAIRRAFAILGKAAKQTYTEFDHVEQGVVTGGAE